MASLNPAIKTSFPSGGLMMQPLLTMLQIIYMNGHTKKDKSVFNLIKKLQNISPMVIPPNYRCSLEHFNDS